MLLLIGWKKTLVIGLKSTVFNNNPNENNCIMPEQPYCPCCKYGFVEPKEYYTYGLVEWHCNYDKFLQEEKVKNNL